jgi:hypothetical protein
VPKQETRRSGIDLAVLISVAGSVLSTTIAVMAWVTGRRAGGLLFAVLPASISPSPSRCSVVRMSPRPG